MPRALLFLVVLSCKNAPPDVVVTQPTVVEAPFERTAASEGVEDRELALLLEDHWNWTMKTWPSWASHLGDRRFDDQIEQSGPEALAERKAAVATFTTRAAKIDRARLSAPDALNLDLLREQLANSTALEVCRFEDWSLSPRGNPLGDLNGWPQIRPLAEPGEARALVMRFKAFPAYIDGQIASLKLGLADGLVANATSTRLVIEMVEAELNKPLTERAAYSQIQYGEDWREAQIPAFQQDLSLVLEGSVAPALRKYADFLKSDVLPVARDDSRAGLAGLPQGKACYAALIRDHTTLNLTPAELHQTGRDQIAKIHGELSVIGQRTFGKSGVPAIIGILREDKSLRFETRAQVEEKAVSALAKANAAMPAFFGKTPKTACVVKTVPDFEAPYTTIAYYQPPAADGSRPGAYFINSYAPETRPRHEAEVLAFHESVPGHHLQIALAQEMAAMPAFRKHGGMTAFVEGWGLYSERLADEMGLYTGDMDRLGMLSFDLWRAGRLVVDTGVHDLGWSREQAEAYLLENTPLAANNIENEVDRYLTTPGQALAYKTGQLEILALRAKAEAELGPAFDLPSFHDAVLGGGAVSLPVLRDRIDRYITVRKLQAAREARPAGTP